MMKVFNKGQVVIPAAVRRALGIEVGDMLDVRIDRDAKSVALTKVDPLEAEALAGSLARYARRKPFPSRRIMDAALRKGLRGEA